MRTMRAISMLLILALAIAPAMASACTIACALPAERSLQVHLSQLELAEAHSAHADSTHAHLDSMHAATHDHSDMQPEAMDMQYCQQAKIDADSPSQHSIQSQHPSALEHHQQGQQPFDQQQQQQQGQHLPDNHQSSGTCSMSGCHFVQSAAAVSADQFFLVDVFTSPLSRANIFGASADLTPPIKPPA